MKPRNFPARKLRRQLYAKGESFDPLNDPRIMSARSVRTKKKRAGKRAAP